MRADSKYVRTIIHPGKLEVVADLRQIGGSPERFPEGFLRSVFVHADGTVELPKDAGRWLGFAAKGKSRRARKARCYTPSHPFSGYMSHLIDLVPKGARVTELMVAQLIDGAEKVKRIQHRVSYEMVRRNLTEMWNAVWRRVLPLLDAEALKLAREVGNEDVLTAYNLLVACPQWRDLAEESKVLVAALLKQGITKIPKQPYKRVGLTTPALKAWAQRQRMFPVYGVTRKDRQSPEHWIRTVGEGFKAAKVTKREVENTLNHIKQFRIHNKVVTSWHASEETVRAFYNDPTNVHRNRQASRGKRQGSSGGRAPA